MQLRRLPEVRLAVWGGLLNAIWEFGQSPLYTDHVRGWQYVVWTRLHCTVGDVLILLCTFWVVSAILRTRSWASRAGLAPRLLFVMGGLVYTHFSEWYNTTVSRTWQYADSMPQLFGIGLTPLLQWIIIPPILLAVLRRDAMASSTQTPEESGACTPGDH